MNGEREEIREIAGRYRRVLDQIVQACDRAGRDPEEVRVVGVSKTKPASTVRAAMEAGIADFGENYVQEFLAKRGELPDTIRWHFIGHLQRNKVKSVLPYVYMVHGVDSERLAVEIDRQAALLGRRVPVLLQVNTSGEESKFGCRPDEALSLGRTMEELPHLDLQGMMTLAAFLDDPERLRPMFRSLRDLRDELRGHLGLPLPHLSMGMTNDFDVAVEEGATLVRIGTALFGSRNAD